MKTIVNNIKTYVDNIYSLTVEFLQHGGDKIFLDIDGVILHSCQAICDIINEQQGTDFDGSEVLSWNFQEICPNLTDEDVERLFEDEAFFHHVKFIEGVKEYINTFKDDIVIITCARPNNFINKKMLFDLENIDVPIIPLPIGMSKSIINMEHGMFIDDSTKHLINSNASVKIQFREYDDYKEREWQKGWRGLILTNWSKSRDD